MINALILMNLIFFSFEIKRCDEVVPVCQKCITGYKMLIYKKVDKRVCKQEDSFNIGIEHCTYLDYTDESKCQECEMGYAVTKDGKECKANSEHCDVLDGDTCIKCEHYFKLTNDNKCEKSTCYSFDEDNNCVCIDGFYKNNKNTCSKIPIKYCYKGNSTYCESCGGGYKYDIGKNECIITEEEFEPIEDTTKINIDHCLELEKNDNTVCRDCDYNYEWDSASKTCKSICAGGVEKLCDECFDNYHSYDYGKTCEKMDLEYNGDDEEDGESDSDQDGNNPDNKGDGSDKDENNSNNIGDNSDKDGDSDDDGKFINFDLVIISLLFLLIL